jgi:hypothetical protein
MRTKPQAALFRVGGLGDLLVALPAIAVVRRALPGHRLTLVGRPEYAALLERAGIVDEAVAFDDGRMAALFGREGAFDVRSKSAPAAGTGTALPGELEVAMGWQNRRGDWPADDLWARQGVGRRCFISYEPGSGRPVSRFFFDRTVEFFSASGAGDGEALGIAGIGANIDPGAGTGRLFEQSARLRLPADLIHQALRGLDLRELGQNEKRLVVHPGSGGRAKRWPLENFVEVIRRVAGRGLEGVLVTGEAEADLDAALGELTLPAGWTRRSRIPAETLAGLLAESTHYLGNDSGPTHLAAASGASVVALFREDNLPAWRPYGKTLVLAAPAVERIGVEGVTAAVENSLAS